MPLVPVVSLTDKVAVVTGASRGIGRQIAIGLAAEGATVALVARSENQLQATADSIEEAGGRALVVPADIRRAENVARIKRTIETKLDVPVILVNAAGVIGPLQSIKDCDPLFWANTLHVNSIAPFFMCQAFVAGMIERQWGRIINVSSAAALAPPNSISSAYVTSKVALNQITRHLAVEVAGTGVTVNAIHPGEVKTGMWADIRAQSSTLGAKAEGFQRWVEWVDETGGDSPQKAVDLVLGVVCGTDETVNGQFLWIDDGLQAPLSGW